MANCEFIHHIGVQSSQIHNYQFIIKKMFDYLVGYRTWCRDFMGHIDLKLQLL